MARYFTITQGLRGCYMPDNAYVIKCETRRELKSALAWEADSITDAGFVGCNKRAVAWLAATLWRRAAPGKRDGGLESVIPYRCADQRDNWAFAIGGSPATRDEYLEYCADND